MYTDMHLYIYTGIQLSFFLSLSLSISPSLSPSLSHFLFASSCTLLAEYSRLVAEYLGQNPHIWEACLHPKCLRDQPQYNLQRDSPSGTLQQTK